jgi:hypothetical protein
LDSIRGVSDSFVFFRLTLVPVFFEEIEADALAWVRPARHLRNAALGILVDLDEAVS